MDREKERVSGLPNWACRQIEEGFKLEILERFRPALKQLKHFSHVKVFWWADKHDNDQDRGTLQCELPYAKGVMAGVFACRAEYRPNPIAVTTCFILDVNEETGMVSVPWIDAFDGTPIIDLKPYIPIADRVRDFYMPEWLADLPAWMEDAASLPPDFFED